VNVDASITGEFEEFGAQNLPISGNHDQVRGEAAQGIHCIIISYATRLDGGNLQFIRQNFDRRREEFFATPTTPIWLSDNANDVEILCETFESDGREIGRTHKDDVGGFFHGGIIQSFVIDFYPYSL
jgi:hypothetical protein